MCAYTMYMLTMATTHALLVENDIFLQTFYLQKKKKKTFSARLLHSIGG